MGTVKFTREEALVIVQKFDELHASGMNVQDASKQAGVSGYSTIRYWQKKYLESQPELAFDKNKERKKYTRRSSPITLDHFTIPVAEPVQDHKTKIVMSIIEGIQSNLKTIIEILKN